MLRIDARTTDPVKFDPSMPSMWTGTGIWMCSRPQNDDKIAWYENDGQQNFTSHTITTLQMVHHPSMPPMWTGTGIWMCSRPQEYDDKIAWYENDGRQNFTSHTITTAADGANPSMPPMWTGTGIWMCSRPHTMMTKSPGMKTMAGRTSPAIASPPLQLGPIRLCRRCGRGRGYGCALGVKVG
jgi:hypothetical protein